jgi:uncharacterized membrane protein
VSKGRLEAFSDGVIAIIITIMVLELKVPHGYTWSALSPLGPVFISYVLSFVLIAIYWNNHHHLLQATKRVSGAVLWSNAHLLFWLSLIPFVTAWMGENAFAPNTVALYGIVLIQCALAYSILVRALLHEHRADSSLARAIGRDAKGNLSLALYAIGIATSFASGRLGLVFYAAVAIIWLVPDRRIERTIVES